MDCHLGLLPHSTVEVHVLGCQTHSKSNPTLLQKVFKDAILAKQNPNAQQN